MTFLLNLEHASDSRLILIFLLEQITKILVRADIILVNISAGVIAELRCKRNNYYLALKLAQCLLQHSFLTHKKICIVVLENLETFLVFSELGNITQKLNLPIPVRITIKKKILLHMLTLPM